MKYSLSFLSAVLLLAGTAAAQKNPKPEKPRHRCVNRFDSTLAKKHELSVSIGIANAPQPIMFSSARNIGPSLAIDYARVYRANHFLRAGIRYFQSGWNSKNDFILPSTSQGFDPNMPDPQGQTNYSILVTNHDNSSTNSHTGLFVGYEYGVGRGRFRFTFGADLVLGYHYQSYYRQEARYRISRTTDPLTQLNEFNIKYLHTGEASGSVHRIFLGLSPRIGIRHDFNRRVALAFTFTPQIGFSQRLADNQSVTGTFTGSRGTAKSLWYASPNLDFRIIFKLGKS